MTTVTIILIVLALIVVIPLGITLVVYIFVPACRGVLAACKHVARFIASELADTLRIVGGVVMLTVLALLAIANLILFRAETARHYRLALRDEAARALGACYRVLLGNPARLFMLTPLVEGVENRLPAMIATAPAPDADHAASLFPGYLIEGTLPGGGSGSKLYIALPNQSKLREFAREGNTNVDRVIIKSFSLAEGSTLPQIIRENRALPAAHRLGLVLEHHVQPDRFVYVTRYVPGETLGKVTEQLHHAAGPLGLDAPRLRQACSYVADLLDTLSHYHTQGLWHKDVKPDNIIISEGKAHLVDFGLVTPLRSSLTLTTHGTEYYRDPEMVRMALRGVRVHEVDGCKFDLYAAGAVLFSVIENAFPAHGGLSRITKPCPEPLRWIVRRAMADYDKRYSTADEMLDDLRTLLDATDIHALRPADLPSVARSPQLHAIYTDTTPPDNLAAPPALVPQHAPARQPTAVTAALPARHASPASPVLRIPDMRVVNWWTGQYAAPVSRPPPPTSDPAGRNSLTVGLIVITTVAVAILSWILYLSLTQP